MVSKIGVTGKGNGIGIAGKCNGFRLRSFPFCGFRLHFHRNGFFRYIIRKKPVLVFPDQALEFVNIDIFIIILAGTELGDQQVGIDRYGRLIGIYDLYGGALRKRGNGSVDLF